MALSDSPASKASPPKSRQKPGTACEECRRRKLRCDRKQPKCGLCDESGKECIATTARPRGPKQGGMKLLQDRIAALEGCIKLQQQNEKTVEPAELGNMSLDNQFELDWSTVTPPEDFSLSTTSSGTETPHASAGPLAASSALDAEPILADQSLPPIVTCHSEVDPMLLSGYSGTNAVEPLNSLSGPTLSDLMQADRDQLYFDRVHAFIPILHQNRYFAWSRQHTKPDSQSCLQYAMWTFASAVSAQHQNVGDSLYQDARRRLDELESTDPAMEQEVIAQVQAWLLLAIYEFTRIDFRRGWMSAGRAFRLIQLMRFHEIDLPNQNPMQTDWIATEEKRRTFWMAYALDRFISIRNGWTLTLSEQVITVRLPAPEADFQAGKPVVMGFLSELITADDLVVNDAFTECIILATVCGRALSHRHQSMVEKIYVETSQDFWDRHKWINATLSKRQEILSRNYPLAVQHTDPMLLFTNMMAQTTVLYLDKLMESATPATEENKAILNEYIRCSSAAAQEVVNMTKSLSLISRFKVHPLTPIPLCLCAEFLMSSSKAGSEVADIRGEQLQHILGALQGLKWFNNLGQDFLQFFLSNSVECSSQVSSRGSSRGSSQHPVMASIAGTDP